MIASLRGFPNEAIGHYRDLLKAYASQLPESREIVSLDNSLLGQTDPILLDETTQRQYHPFVYPFYASILAYHPQAHEVLDEDACPACQLISIGSNSFREFVRWSNLLD